MSKLIDSGVEWIDVIPDTWDVVQLGSLFLEHKHKNIGLKSKNLLSLSYGNIIRKDINTTDGLLPESFEGYNIIDDGDIVLRLTDLQNDHRSLRVGLCHEKGIITSAYVTLRKRKEDIDSLFFYYLIHSFDIRKGFYGMGAGVRQGLNYAGVSKIMLPLPPTDVQKTISSFLSTKLEKVNDLIDTVQEQIKKLKLYRQSLINEIVTNGLSPSVEKKSSGVDWIEHIPVNWNVLPLKALFTFGKGLPITKENLVDEGVPVISYGQIHAKWNSGVTTHRELYRYVGEEYLDSNPASIVSKGDIIMADTSEDRDGCGNCAYIDSDDTIFAGYHTIILRSTNGTNNKYLAYLFLTDAWRSQIRKCVSGVKLFSISRRILNSTTVVIPDDSEEIVSYLDEKCGYIDGLIAIKEKKIEKLEQYKKSLIYEYVTGKKEVS